MRLDVVRRSETGMSGESIAFPGAIGSLEIWKCAHLLGASTARASDSPRQTWVSSSSSSSSACLGFGGGAHFPTDQALSEPPPPPPPIADLDVSRRIASVSTSDAITTPDSSGPTRRLGCSRKQRSRRMDVLSGIVSSP